MNHPFEPDNNTMESDDVTQPFSESVSFASSDARDNIPNGRYASSEEHLWDELRRVDQLVRAQTVRWWMTIASSKPNHLWGMIHVTDAEIEAYLRAPFLPPEQLSPEIEEALSPYWQMAAVLARAIQERRARTSASTPLRLARLQTLFGLSDLERDVLLVCLLAELEPRYRRLYAYLQDDASRTRPSVELVLQILHPVMHSMGAGRGALGSHAPLQRQFLVQLDHSTQSAEPLPARSLRLDDRIAAFLLAQDALDARLHGIVTESTVAVQWNELFLESGQIEQLQALASWKQEGDQSAPPGATLFFHGSYGSERLAAARAICTANGTPLLVVDVAAALRNPLGWKTIITLALREAVLREAALYWSGCEELFESEQPPHRWQHLSATLEQHEGLTFLASQTAWDPAGHFHTHPFLRLEFPPPGYELRRRTWSAHLPPELAMDPSIPERDALLDMLANSFQCTPGQIIDAIHTARSLAVVRSPIQPRLTISDLYAGCRRQSSQKLVTMAQRIEPRSTLTFADLVLPPPSRRQLEELRHRIHHRSQVYSGLGLEQRLSLGKGLIVLFSGSSGTGKTMSAELLAQEQGVDLYKVDLSAVVSKYVGETEKNLSRVFAEAEDANAIIFFDEADALFGKRGEVKEARDRWANIEVNYLLQRVEEYAGTVILTSNLRQNIDEAFLRRIHVIVEFPFPDAHARFRILQGMFPPGIAHPPDHALRALAERFQLPGGSWKNIVIDAAFRALAELDTAKTPEITLRHLVAATGREYQKLGKPLTKGEFKGEFYAWVTEDILVM